LTELTKRKKEEIGVAVEAWHQAFVALAERTREKTVPYSSKND